MKINYILSDTTKSATSAAIMSVVKKAEQNPFQDFVVIVPETKSIIIEKEVLDRVKTAATTNVFIYSFVRFINRLNFVSADKIVSKQVCVLLLRKIIYDNIKRLNCYKKTAKTIGFAEKMYETISQFKSSNVSVEDLKLSLETKSESLKAKLEDIILLYEEYEKALGEDKYDELDKLNLISKFAKSSDFIKSAEIYVVGFDNITYEMVSVLKDLAANAKELTVSSVYFNEKREDKHIQSNELYAKFQRVAEELKYPYNPIFFKSKKQGDFYAIQNYLFANKQYKVKSQGAVQVFESKSKRQEIEFVANQIIKEIQNGKRYKDIGVFVCDLENNSELIKEIFDDYGISYFINTSYDISNHFFIKFIMSALELVLHNAAADKVLSFISNPLWAASDFSIMHRYLRETGDSYESVFEYIQKKDYSKEFEKQVKSILTRLSLFYFEFKNKILAAKTVADYLAAIKWLIEYFEVKDKLEEIAKQEEQDGYLVESSITNQVFEKQEKFMAAAENFMGGLELSFDEFIQIYFTGFSTIKINVSPVSIDTVIVQSNTDGFYNIKTMFVVSAEEGKFPSKIDDSGIILDREIEETIQNIKKPVEPTVKEINKRENYRIYEAILEPTEKLYLSYSLFAHDGKANNPARVILRLINLFGEEILIKNYEPVKFVNYKLLAKDFAKSVNKFLRNEHIEKNEAEEKFNQLENRVGENFARFLREFSQGEEDFIIKNAEGLYFFGNKTSVSQLEKYFTCPYLFFTKYGLRLKENKSANISSLDVGTIIHRIVELFVVKIDELKEKTEKELFDTVELLMKQAVEESEVSLTKNKSILNLIFIEAKRLCKHIFNEQINSGFKHKKSEWKFEGESAIKLTLSNGNTISLEGTIDRIDEFNNYIRIIDYKTGSVDSEYSAIYYGTKIQLISYLSAATKYGDKKVAGVFYLPIHSDYADDDKMLKNMYKMQGFLLDDIEVVKHMDYTLSLESDDKKSSAVVPIKVKSNGSGGFDFSGVHSKNMTAEEFESVKEYTEELCKTAVEEILSGYIEPAAIASSFNDINSRCKYCLFAGFCAAEKSKYNLGRICANKVNSSSFSKEEEVDD